MDDMSGDGVAGGAFMAGFTVVNYGNVVYARPGYVENPLVPSTLSNGSLANPYPVLAPEGNPSTAPANPTHNPNGGLNSPTFFQPGQLQHGLRFQRRRRVRTVGPVRGLAVDICRSGLFRSWRSGRRRRLAGHSPAQPDHRAISRRPRSCFRLPPATTAA